MGLKVFVVIFFEFRAGRCALGFFSGIRLVVFFRVVLLGKLLVVRRSFVF